MSATYPHGYRSSWFIDDAQWDITTPKMDTPSSLIENAIAIAQSTGSVSAKVEDGNDWVVVTRSAR